MNIPKLLDAQNRSNIPMKSPQFPKFPVQLSVRLTTNLQLRDMFSPDGTLKKTDMTHEPQKKNKPYGFHYTGCFIGILTMVEYNPYIPGFFDLSTMMPDPTLKQRY